MKEGKKSFYGLRVRDSHLGVQEITVKEAFARSSNVAFAKLADEYYHNQPKRFYDHLHHLRLDTVTGIDIVGAAVPLIKNPVVSIGQKPHYLLWLMGMKNW